MLNDKKSEKWITGKFEKRKNISKYENIKNIKHLGFGFRPAFHNYLYLNQPK